MVESSHGRGSFDGLLRPIGRPILPVRCATRGQTFDERSAGSMTAPRVIRLTAGAASATLDLDRGGRLASWSVHGRDLLVGPPRPGDSTIRWGCFLMAPWAGR